MRVFREYAAATSQPRLLPGPTRYDEVAAPDGSLRRIWRRLAAETDDIQLEDLTRIGHEIDRVITDDGVLYTPPGKQPVSWRLDPVPLVIESDEWALLERGLTQRTELLNAVLADVYGPQQLLSQGWLPPQVVFGHSGFLRVVARQSAADSRPLVIAATDVGRRADGRWQALADRAQAPSGIGFAMENRRVLSRVLPEAYRTALPHRLAPFFQALRVTLLQAAPAGVENPRVVVLSPGPMSETAYDQAAIATRLGFPLVEGSDLLVTDGTVLMRVLGRAPERVDVILRRVDADWSDPLELRGESQLGVAGLTEAVRRGTVRVVNGLGSGVLENPGLLPFLPALCEHLLDEPLRLASVPTWWAGDPAQREVLLDRIDELSIRKIDAPLGRVRGSATGLRERIIAEPHRYVGQERPVLSVAPTLDGGRLASQEVRLRTFTMWHGSSYRTMFGALASSVELGEHTGPGVSKDVWVLKSSSSEPDQGLDKLKPVSSARTPVAMGPRILDDLFWLGRYVERMEGTVRLVIATHGLAQDFQDRPSTIGGQTLGTVMDALEQLSPGRAGCEDDQANLRALLLDESRPGSVAESLWHLRRVAQGVRDQVSADLFRVFGAIERAQQAVRDNPHSAQVGESAGRLLTDALALSAVTENMMRDAGWHLIKVGTAIERGQQLTRLLASTLAVRQGLDVEHEVLSVVLATAESAITHRRRYRGAARVSNVLGLLLLDADNPRSLRFALARLDRHLAALPGSTGSTRPERLIDDLIGDLDERMDLTALAAVDGVTRPELIEFTGRIQRQLRTVSDAVAEVHFPFGPAQHTFDLSGSRA